LFIQSQEFFGADSQIHASIMSHLDRDRFDVHCAVPRGAGGRRIASAERIEQIPDVHVIPTEFGPSARVARRIDLLIGAALLGPPAVVSVVSLARYARRNGVEVVHCTEKPRDVLFASLVARLSGAKTVIHVHVKAEEWIRASVRRLMHSADALVGVSEFVAGSIREMGYSPDRVFAVLNGLEVHDWVDPQADPGQIRREFDVPAEVPLLVSASRLYRYKGQHELLAALPAVKQNFPDVRVLIVGEDDPSAYQDELSYTDTLREMCDELDLDDNVTFTGFRTDVREIMAAADLYVMPSHEEPFGMVFIEAMSLEKPVVALNNGGTKEVVDHGGSGLLSERGDHQALADNITTLLADEALRARMGRHGRQRVEQYLNAVRMTRDMERVYDSIIGGPDAAVPPT
jgi:glycosyltransferase involved in cell wall biosynthesis